MATPLIQASTIKVDTSVGGGVGVVSTAVDSSGATKGVVFVSCYNSTPPDSVTDSKGNTWTQSGAGFAVDTNPTYVYCYLSNLTSVGTGHTVTVAANGSFGSAFVVIFVKPSAGGTLSVTAWNGAVSNTSPHTSTAIDPTPDEALLIAAGAHDQNSATQTYTWTGSSFTELLAEKDFQANFPLSTATRNFNAAGTVTASFTSTGATHGGIGVLAITESGGGGGGGSTVKSFTLLGVG
jgi:hypothetical protein